MISPRPLSPTVEQLDERLVPAVLDLTTRGAEVIADGFIARQVDTQPTGSGAIDSFVRIQGSARGGGSEQGYNTTARPLEFDENKSPRFTRGLTVGEVPQVIVNGVAYREFLLDINQKGSDPYLSVDEVRVFLAGTSNLTGYDAASHTLAGMNAVFDLDANGDVSLLLNYRLNHGSGSGDMTLLIPDSAFAGADPGTFVYLYSKMGEMAGATANSGFEEWAVREAPRVQPPVVQPPVEQPAANNGSLSGFVFVDANRNGLKDASETGIGGVTIQLQSVDDLGNTVTLTTTTGIDGSYAFTGLRAGTYSILETQPENFNDGPDFVGTIGGQTAGSLDNDRLFDILLGPDQQGVNYNFTEQFKE